MAIDLEAIRRKLAKLNGVYTSKVQLWKPAVGDHRIRALPWPDATPEEPFKELYFYYLGNEMPMVAPFQFGKPDPINDLVKSLYASKIPEDKELAKKLRASPRTYIPIIDRADEKAGPMLWAFGKTAYQRMLGFFLDEDTVNWLSTGSEGYDLKVQMLPPSVGMHSKAKTKLGPVDTAKKPSVATNDPELLKKWMSSIPNLMDLYPIKSADEIQKILEKYLAGDLSEEVQSEEISRGEDSKEVTENEVVEKKETKTTNKARKSSSTEEEKIDASKALDDAFNSVLGDDD